MFLEVHVDPKKLFASETLPPGLSAQRLAPIVSDYLFISGLKRFIESTGTFIGDKAGFSGIFINLINNYGNKIRFISPWEALLNLYRQIQLAVNAAA